MSRAKLLLGRHSIPGCVYHITVCTYQRAPKFITLSCGRIVVSEMKKLHEAKMVTSIAWVLMPDHLHWLFQLGDVTELSTVVKTLKGKTARRLNLVLDEQGHIWQKGYHDHAIRQDEDLRRIARYIVANPLRAGLVESVGDYPLWDASWL